LPDGVHPRIGVEMLAVRKGRAVVDTLSDCDMVISSDTLVELDGVALGKPADEEDAVRMLGMLSGRVHNVHTGVAVHYRGRCLSATESVPVTFRNMTDCEIRDYVKSGEPMDKAGAYGIQGLGGRFVVRYDGNFDTVMGLPTRLLKKLMNEAAGEEVFGYDEG